MPYDVVNGINDPVLYGFSGGVSTKDLKTLQYVGYGNYTGSPCDAQNPVSGYVLTSPALSAGVYMVCTNDYKAIYNGHYLLKHSNLKWVPTNTTAMMTLPGTLMINPVRPFMFGRILYKGNFHIGKLHAGGGAYGLWLSTADGSLIFTTNYVYKSIHEV